MSIPCKKRSYRLYGKEGYALVDIMTGENEPSPKVLEFDIYLCLDCINFCTFLTYAPSVLWKKHDILLSSIPVIMFT